MCRTTPALILFTWVSTTGAQDIISLYPVQDAVIGYHFQLNSENTNYNYADWFGALSQPGTLGGENHSRSLILFDLSSLPPGTVVEEALLDLYGRGPVGLGEAASVGNMGANACWLEQIIEPWDDNTVTWNTRPATTSLNAVLVPASTMVIEDYIGVDVTGLVQAMINSPATSHGFALRTQVESPTRGLFFCGAGFSDQAKRPRLRIKFNSDVGVTEYAPLGGPLVHPNPASPGRPLWLRLPVEQVVDHVVIFDSSGRVIQTTRVDRGTTEVRMDGTLAPGVYQMTIMDPRGAVIGATGVVVLAE